MKDSIIFLRKLRKFFPEITMGLEWRGNFYFFNGNTLDYEYNFHFKNEIDGEYEYLKSKNLREPFQKKALKNLTKYWEVYQKEQERQRKPKKFIKED